MTAIALRREGQAIFLVADPARDLAVWVNTNSRLATPAMGIAQARTLVPERDPVPLTGDFREEVAVAFGGRVLGASPGPPDQAAIDAYAATLRWETDIEPRPGDEWLDALTAIEQIVEADISDAVTRDHNCWTVINSDRSGYVQWVAGAEGELTVECASEHSAKVIADLAHKYADLRHLGWHDPHPPDRPNWFLDLGPDMHGRPQMTAELCVRTLLEFYDMTPTVLRVDTWGGAPRRPLLTGG